MVYRMQPENHGPLAGIKVLDFSRVLAGPFCTMLLADLGADVVKVEPLEGDETRQWGPPWIGELSAYFMSINRNKRSIVLDLKNELSREVVNKLARWADVVVENFRPGVASKLGIDYETLRNVNPRIIYCSISGFGQDGPYRDKPGYDIIALALSGLMDITGEPGRPPIKFGVPIADLTTATHAALAIVSALYYRENSGRGQYIDISMLDVQVSLLTHQAYNYFASKEEPKKLGSAHPNIAPYQAFKTKDGYLIVGVGNDRLWEKFCKVLGRPDLINDHRFKSNPERVRNREELAELLTSILVKENTDHWVKKLEEHGIPCSPVLRMSEALNNEHVIHRKMVISLTHPISGSLNMLGIPFKFSLNDCKIRRFPPKLGEHTEEVLKELGFDDESISELRNKRVIL